MNHQTLLQQIGTMNVLAISGGRNLRLTDALHLPYGAGRSVVITLDADDTYRVRQMRRVHRGVNRGTLVTVYEVAGVYADQIGDVAYHASTVY